MLRNLRPKVRRPLRLAMIDIDPSSDFQRDQHMLWGKQYEAKDVKVRLRNASS
jgi:hypothetical protein